MTTKPATVPAYAPFLAALNAKVKAAGISTEVRELKDYVCLEFTASGQKLYVPKNVQAVKPLHTTLDVAGLVPGAFRPAKENGKIEAHVEPDLEVIAKDLLPLLADPANRLRANKVPAKKDASPATPSGREGTIQDVLGNG